MRPRGPNFYAGDLLELPVGWIPALLPLAVFQTAAALRLRRRAAELGRSRLQDAPAAAILVPVKGLVPGLEETVRSLLAQEYPAPLEWIFAVADAGDPALPLLREALRGQARARVLVTGATPGLGSAKAANLAAAVAAVSPDAVLLLFADAGLRARPDWAARLAAALEDPRAGLATAAALDDPRRGPCAILRLAWTAFGLPWFEPMGVAAGHSLALRRADYESWGVAGLWSRAVCEDLALAERAIERGRRVVLVPAAAPESLREAGPLESLARLNRWMRMLRHGAPRVWRPGFAVTAVKCGAYALPLWPARALGPALVVAAADALLVALVLRAHGRSVLPAAAAPLLPPLFALNYAASACARSIDWAGWRYRFDGSPARRLEARA